MDLFAGVAVSDLPRAVAWFDRLFGEVETFEPNDTERVWTLAEHCHLYAELRPEHAGHAIVTMFVDDFDGFLETAAGRGVDSHTRETYANGVRKAIYRDPDGNEIGVGGPPADRSAGAEHHSVQLRTSLGSVPGMHGRPGAAMGSSAVHRS